MGLPGCGVPEVTETPEELLGPSPVGGAPTARLPTFVVVPGALGDEPVRIVGDRAGHLHGGADYQFLAILSDEIRRSRRICTKRISEPDNA